MCSDHRLGVLKNGSRTNHGDRLSEAPGEEEEEEGTGLGLPRRARSAAPRRPLHRARPQNYPQPKLPPRMSRAAQTKKECNLLTENTTLDAVRFRQTCERPIQQTPGQREAHNPSRTIILAYLHSAQLPQTLPVRRRARLLFARDHDQRLQFTTSAHTSHRHLHCIPQRLVESSARADDLQAREGGPELRFGREAERGHALLNIVRGKLDEAQYAQVPHGRCKKVPTTVRHADQGSMQNERVQSGHSGGNALENRQRIFRTREGESDSEGHLVVLQRSASGG
ncbi:uncharacterized protein C8Q71DRAFT_209617 [Rhodofomes roseus]|uniref:Uncharacterized protein n=1 Tax=Rhodofomes roseus TaxID=34475 RepID=A0ABQ8KUD0_9APHY|nr:uncharacterized protein C8Q71DRAFT_209617 [Rhodofomes roseus]KAH9842579.1 hypothetical protein C8Q71DRAFT_209617 [Rhodofomes roseus]